MLTCDQVARQEEKKSMEEARQFSSDRMRGQSNSGQGLISACEEAKLIGVKSVVSFVIAFMGIKVEKVRWEMK